MNTPNTVGHLNSIAGMLPSDPKPNIPSPVVPHEFSGAPYSLAKNPVPMAASGIGGTTRQFGRG